MKKSILILISFLCLKGFSQSSILLTNNGTGATLAANTVISLTTSAAANKQVIFDIKNTSSTQKSYNAKRYDVVLNSGASAYFCFAGTCYGDQVFVSPTPLVLNANQSASQVQGQYNMLMADLDEGSVVGYSLVKYTFFNASNSSDSIQVSIVYNSALNVSKNAKPALYGVALFPNPAKDMTTITVNSEILTDAKFSIYNALGTLVSEKTFIMYEGKNKLDINVSDLNSGVYFLELKTANNSSVTKRLIIR